MGQTNVLIVGGGPIGLFCATLAKIKGLTPILIEANAAFGGQPYMMYSQKDIHDVPGFNNIKAYQLVEKLLNQFNEQKIEHYLNCSIKTIEKSDNNYTIHLTNNKTLSVNKIIIATGIGQFIPNLLPVEPINSTNIQYQVLNFDVYRDKKIIILGGGDSAVDWANALNTITNKVSILHRRDEFRAHGDNVNKLKENKINILLNKQVTKIENNVLYFKDNVTNEVSHINFDYLIVQYGQTIDKTSLQVFKGLALNQERVIVDAKQKTNLEDIYAIGDVCIYDSKPRSLVCGFGEASVAIRDIVNNTKNYV